MADSASVIKTTTGLYVRQWAVLGVLAALSTISIIVLCLLRRHWRKQLDRSLTIIAFELEEQR
ncbi:hypothetical protein EJ03DRAFT_27951 [Teratosphaeria nubilosa]|uniref:Uncharacterized protein n=1 Tax=Teratosphaeria nubilosa TaxID=161662 RepID=A0A6G1KUW9_9PEZI|nr:hypothetical protein EJ03DRAFT_27951 [Teratosphaeria nubilosa]